MLRQPAPAPGMAATSDDLDMTGARGAVPQDDANADDETQPAADAVWPALLAQPVAAASLLPTTPGTMLAILFGSLVFAGIALRGIMLTVRRAA
jgi:hypothetical protein